MPAFISEWKTDNAGTSNNDQITLPLVSGGTYDFTVEWGDGSQDTITAHDQAEVTHTYSAAGTYTVEITGTISGWQFNDGGDKDKILDVSQWGDLAFGVNENHFRGCSNLDVSATDAPDLTGVTSLRNCFRNTAITTADLSAWDVSSVTNMGLMFENSAFNGDVSQWDVSNVTRLDRTFRLSSFNGDVSQWDVSNATFINGIFQSSPFSGDVSKWDVSSVEIIADSFRSTPFNGDLSQWDVSSVTNSVNAFNDSEMSAENYSRALVAWSRLPLQSGVEWSNTNAQYFSGAAAEARAKIANDFGWTISDNGEDTSSTSYAVVGQVLDGTTPLTGEPVVWTSEQDVELDAVTSALHGEQAGRFAVMTTDALTFPNASDVNGTGVTLDSATFIYEQDVGLLGVGAEEADVTTTQAAQLTSADTLVYRTLDAGTLQALQTVSASVIGIFDASASTRQQQQRAEAAADVVATITLDAVTRQAQQGTAASVLLRAKIDALTRQQPQLAQVAAEIVGIISAAAETQQQPQRATADLQSTTSVSVGTQQQPQIAAATALVATILQTVTRQLPQRTTAAFGDLVRARIQATSIRRAIDLQTSITRP